MSIVIYVCRQRNNSLNNKNRVFSVNSSFKIAHLQDCFVKCKFDIYFVINLFFLIDHNLHIVIIFFQ